MITRLAEAAPDAPAITHEGNSVTRRELDLRTNRLARAYANMGVDKGDMILSGGANIYPAEVEAALDAFPGVRSSAVIGLSDEDLGQVVHAIVDPPLGTAQGTRRRLTGFTWACWRRPTALRSSEMHH